MGKKCIIEFEDKPFHKDGDFLYRVKGFNSLVFDMTGISKLTPYTEPDLEQVRKEEYDRGYDDAKGGYENGFENGMIVAWDAAKKISTTPVGELKKILDIEEDNNGMLWPFHEYTAAEAIEKLKAYEQEKEMDGLRQNILTIVDKCGYTLDEVVTILEKMRGEQDG